MELSEALVRSLVESTDPFPVDFEDAWQWIGYTRKETAKKKLVKNFSEDVDYIKPDESEANQLASQFGEASWGGHNREVIRLAIDCFKSFCMMAGTVKGREVRQYFLECERQVRTARQSIAPSQPKDSLDVLQQAIAVLIQQRDEMNEIKDRISKIEYGREEAKEAILALPEAEVEAPEISDRMLVNRLMRQYQSATNVNFVDMWSMLYREFRDTYHIDLKKRAEGKKAKPLDVCEDLGLMKDLYAVAQRLFSQALAKT